MKSRKLFFVAIVAIVLLGGFFTVSNTAFADSGIITCGKGQTMCTLCDLIAGMNTIIQYLMKIAIGVALLAMSIGGVMYIISAGDKGMIDKAKSAMANAAWGFVIIFAGYLIIDTTINYVGAKTAGDKGGVLGINVTSWGKFECRR